LLFIFNANGLVPRISQLAGVGSETRRRKSDKELDDRGPTVRKRAGQALAFSQAFTKRTMARLPRMKSKRTHERETVPQRIPWDADNVTAGGLTSLDVLLLWLLTPGKYEFFHSKQRGKALQEIRAQLGREGVHHRSEASIRGKVSAIEKQYAAAKTWLKEINLRSKDVVYGRVDGDVEAKVLAICPNFCELMPVLQDSGSRNVAEPTPSSAAKGGQDETSDTEKDVRPKQKKRRAEKESPSQPRQQRPAASSAVAAHSGPLGEERVHRTEASVLNCVRQTLTYGKLHCKELDLSGRPQWFQHKDERAMIVRDLDAPLPPDVRRQVADVKLQHAKKSSQAVLEHEDKMMACDVEVKRGRGQVQLILEKVLAREAMKKQGVPKEEINDMLPLKKK
jgi:hypothetical protein